MPTFCPSRDSRTMLLNLWVKTLWGLNDPFLWVPMSNGKYRYLHYDSL